MPRRKVTDPQVLVDAAAELFQKHGYPSTTIDDVAAAVGVTKPTVYQYIESKERLLESVFDVVFSRLEADQREVTERGGNPADQIRDLLRRWVDVITTYRHHIIVVLDSRNEFSVRARRKYTAWGRRLQKGTQELFHLAAAEGVVREDVSPQLAGQLTSGMLLSIARWYDPSGPLSPERIAEQVIALLEGYFVDGASAQVPVAAEGRAAR